MINTDEKDMMDEKYGGRIMIVPEL